MRKKIRNVVTLLKKETVEMEIEGIACTIAYYNTGDEKLGMLAATPHKKLWKRPDRPFICRSDLVGRYAEENPTYDAICQKLAQMVKDIHNIQKVQNLFKPKTKK